MADEKRLVDMGCNTAILGCFAFAEEGGVFVAAGIGVAQFFFDWFYPQAQTPTQFAPIDHVTLDTALEKLGNQMTDAAWKSLLDTQTDIVLTQSSDFWDMYKVISKLKLNPRTFVPLNSQTYADCDAYFDLGHSTVLDQLSNARNLITLSSANDDSMTDLEIAEHYTTTTGLYVLIASLTCTYLKCAIVWRRAKHVLAWLQYDQYQDDQDTWDNKTPASIKSAHPTWAPRPVDKPKDQFMEWEEWAAQDLAVAKLLNAVDPTSPDSLVGYSQGTPARAATAAEPAKTATKGLQVRMVENWKTCMSNIGTRLQSVTIVTANPNGQVRYSIADSVVKFASASSASMEMMDFRRRLRCGALLAHEWEASMGQFALSRVDEADIAKYGDAIQLWRAAGASVQFTLYTVQTGDTLRSISAQAYGGDDQYYLKIFNFNKDSLTDPDVLKAGQILMLPKASVLGDIH